VIAVGLWGFISIVGGHPRYPAYIQRFEVKPTNSRRSRRNITRKHRGDPVRRSGSTTSSTQQYNYQEKPHSEDHPGEPGRRSATRDSGTPGCSKGELPAEPVVPAVLHVSSDLGRRTGTRNRANQAAPGRARFAVRELKLRRQGARNSTWLKPAPRVHAMGNARRPPLAAKRGSGRTKSSRLPGVPTSRPPARPRSRSTSRASTTARGLRGFHGRRQQAETRTKPTASQDDSDGFATTGSGGVATSKLPAQGRAFALNFGSWDLFISHQVRTRNSRVIVSCGTCRRAFQKAAPVPQVRDADPYSVVIGRQGRVGPRRVHHDEPLPVLAVAATPRA